jgi:hypothetical protein
MREQPLSPRVLQETDRVALPLPCRYPLRFLAEQGVTVRWVGMRAQPSSPRSLQETGRVASRLWSRCSSRVSS